MPFLGGLILALALCATCSAQDGYVPEVPEQPFSVVEEYDAIAVVHIRRSYKVRSQNGEESDVYWYDDKMVFFRNGKVVADRSWSEDKEVTRVGDKFAVQWREYGWRRPVDRLILADNLFELTGDDVKPEDPGWWAGRMTDLESPPEE